MLNVCTVCYNNWIVSDIAIFVLKRDVKLQLTNYNNWMCVNYAYLLVLMYSFFSEIVRKFCRMVCGDMSFTFFVALAPGGA